MDLLVPELTVSFRAIFHAGTFPKIPKGSEFWLPFIFPEEGVIMFCPSAKVLFFVSAPIVSLNFWFEPRRRTSVLNLAIEPSV